MSTESNIGKTGIRLFLTSVLITVITIMFFISEGFQSCIDAIPSKIVSRSILALLCVLPFVCCLIGYIFMLKGKYFKGMKKSVKILLITALIIMFIVSLFIISGFLVAAFDWV